jgi:hypothetical protein
MLSEPAADLGMRIERATIVSRRSGEGYRLVLGLRPVHGTPMPETLADCFSSPAEAQQYAVRDLGLLPDRVAIRI